MTHRLPCLFLVAIGLAGCSSETDGAPPVVDKEVRSFAQVTAQGIEAVGVVIPVSSFEAVPAMDAAFHGAGVEMPAEVRDGTFIQLLRINWYPSGHGPVPYDAPHFDLHFFRGSATDLAAIACPSMSSFPDAILAEGYAAPTTCVTGMGYHAWPQADLDSGVFTGSIIFGYAEQRMVFIEPMITQKLLLARQSFELPITRPASAGGETTLFPAHFSATYDSATDSYAFRFEQLSPID